MRCPVCQRDNREGRQFCGGCGVRLPLACLQCGSVNEPDEDFCGRCGARLVEGPERETAAAIQRDDRPRESDAVERRTGERRQLTVLFCDLVGSTALAEQMDPEDWRAVAGAYQQAAAATVERSGGHVAKYLGDGLLIYFGYPQAHDDDAERAVRAGLGIVQAVRNLPLAPSLVRRGNSESSLLAKEGIEGGLHVRVGIHTGLAVIADAGERADIFGDTANLAARVQAAAAADTVLISAATYRLVSGLFIVDERGPQKLKGVREPIALYRVVQPSGVRSKLAAAAAHGLTPFVGREHERQLLRARFEQACDGEGQVVLIVGEAGIGKSRLAEVLRSDLAEVRHTWLECGGAPYFSNTPFYAVSELLKQFFAWKPNDTAATRIAALERALGTTQLNVTTALPLLAPILDLEVPPGYPPVLGAPEVARKRRLATLAQWVLEVARLQPLVILLEDLHWVDPSTLELQQLLVDQGATAPLLLLYTARSEFRVSWPLRAHHTQLTLNRLARKYTQEMVEQVAARAALTPDVVDTLVTRTDGVPLFVEELTKAVVEVGARGLREIPATLHDSLMARLDRLGPAKEVAQVAAVIGREFTYDVLRHLVGADSRAPRSEDTIQAALARLVDAELVYARGVPPEATYMFKHVLVRDAAYESLLKSRRRTLHGQVATVLAKHFSHIAAAQPELLAQHYTEAGESEPAVKAWRRAGTQALSRGAPGEAERHLRRGLEVHDTLPENPRRDEGEFRLQLLLGHALLVTKGYASPEVAAAFERARELGIRTTDPVQLVMLLMGLWALTLNRDGPAAARPLADQALSAADRVGFPPVQVWAHFAQAATLYFLGNLADAREQCTRVLDLYDEATAIVTPIDPSIAALGYAALTAAHMGLADTARAYAQQGIAWAERAKRPADRAWAEQYASTLQTFLHHPAEAMAHAERTCAACAEEPNPVPETVALMQRGWALAERGEARDGLDALRAALERFHSMDQRIGIECFLGLLAQAHARAGNIAEALQALDDAEGAVPGDEVYRAETLRWRGELLMRAATPAVGAAAPTADRRAEAERCFREAIAVAGSQGAKLSELRAATGLARLLREQGKPSEARELLAPIYAWFTEGFDTYDLIEAKRLLQELG